MSTNPSNSNDEPIPFSGEQDVDLHFDGVNFEIDEKEVATAPQSSGTRRVD